MFWLSVRDASGNTFGEEPSDIGKARYLIVPDGVRPEPAHAKPRKKWLAELMAQFPPGADGKRRGDIVIFVHGYNNTIDHVALRHQLIANGLRKAGFPCLVVSFDWPSGDTALGYLEDRHDAKQTAMMLVTDGIRVLTDAQTADCLINIHVVAHSMGAYVVREAFDDADDTVAADTNWTVSQTIFLAGDVSAPSFANGNTSTTSLYRHTYRLTNYYSLFDEPLHVSSMKRVGLSPRVGRVGLPDAAPDKAVDVNCSARYQAIAPNGPPAGVMGDPTHSWYFHDSRWIADVAHTLAGKIDRSAIPTRSAAGGADNNFDLRP